LQGDQQSIKGIRSVKVNQDASKCDIWAVSIDKQGWSSYLDEQRVNSQGGAWDSQASPKQKDFIRISGGEVCNENDFGRRVK